MVKRDDRCINSEGGANCPQEYSEQHKRYFHSDFRCEPGNRCPNYIPFKNPTGDEGQPNTNSV